MKKANTTLRLMKKRSFIFTITVFLGLLLIGCETEDVGSSIDSIISKGVFEEKKEEIWVFNYVEDDAGVIPGDEFSATVTICSKGDHLYMDYDGDDLLDLRKTNLSFKHKYMSLEKTEDGIDMYNHSCPSPFDQCMWGISSDRKTLYYLTRDRLTFKQ